MLQNKRLINGKKYKPAGGGGHRRHNFCRKQVKDLANRIAVFHLLPRYAQGAENTARRGQHRGKFVLVDDRGALWQVYFTTPTRLRYRSTALTACAALSSSICAVSLV